MIFLIYVIVPCPKPTWPIHIDYFLALELIGRFEPQSERVIPDTVKYLIESATQMTGVPAHQVESGFRAVDFDLVGKKAEKAKKKQAKAEKKKNKKGSSDHSYTAW